MQSFWRIPSSTLWGTVLGFTLGCGWKPPQAPQSAFFLLLNDGTTNAIAQFIEEDPTVVSSLQGDDTTPLVYALLHDRYDVARLLLRKGADVDQAFGRQKGTALCCFAYRKLLRPVTFLLENGANPNHRLPPHTGPSLLMVLAGERPDPGIINQLLKHGADTSFTLWGQNALDYAQMGRNTNVIIAIRNHMRIVAIRSNEPQKKE